MARLFSTTIDLDNWESPQEPKFELAQKLYPKLKGYTLQQFKDASDIILYQMQDCAVIDYQD